MFRFGTYKDDLLTAAVRAGGAQIPRVWARRGDVLLDVPFDILDGQIVDSPGGGGVRRTLTIEVEDATGQLYDLLSPTGTTLRAETAVQLTDQQLAVPMGVFEVDVQKASLGPGGGLRLTCPDKYAQIQRAGFIRPEQPRYMMAATQQIAELVRGALGADEPVLNYSRSLATVPASLVFDDDRAKAIEDLAEAAAVHVGFDRLGRCQIVDLPTLSSRSDWLIDASPSGVLLDGDRERSRRKTANVVIVTSSVANPLGPNFDPVIVWDSDPASMTYAGPDPINRPDLAGPFGVVPYRWSSPLLTDAFAAQQAAEAILARVTGLASQLSLSTVRHPGLDAFDVTDVLPPRRTPSSALVVERHIVDSVTHPLTVGSQSITGRSTRADEYGG